MTAQIGMNDAVLMLSLLYLSVDIQYEWQEFGSCHKPIHKWLLVSYALIVMSRLIYIVGTMISAAEAGDFLLNLRQKSTALRLLMSLTWLVLVPLFAFWSAIGTAWIWQIRTHTPECLPNGVHLWFLVLWQALSYIWVLVHGGLGVVAWVLENRLRRAEIDLREIEDADVVSRWGEVSRLQGYTSLAGMSRSTGLSAKEIRDLPSALVAQEACEAEEECPICLVQLRPGESIRQLGACGHTFHRPCIDLWLLRRADCPLCKSKVGGSSVEQKDVLV